MARLGYLKYLFQAVGMQSMPKIWQVGAFSHDMANFEVNNPFKGNQVHVVVQQEALLGLGLA